MFIEAVGVLGWWKSLEMYGGGVGHWIGGEVWLCVEGDGGIGLLYGDRPHLG